MTRALIILGTAGALAQACCGVTSPPALTGTAPGANAIRTVNRKLRRAVLLSLSRTNGLLADGIVVIAKGGVVMLTAYVPDAGQIGLATSAGKLVNGVSEVHNSLTVQANGW